MKIKGHYVSVGVTFVLLSSQICSSTILSGAMFYYLMGSYIAREVFPNVVSNAVKAFVPETSAASASTSLTSTISTSPSSSSDTDTMASMIQLANAIGLTRQIKELWPELDCSLNPCPKNKTATKKKLKNSDEEDDEEEAFSKPELTASEELVGYKIFGNDEDDILTTAHKELADEDPFNFYYAMKDEHKRKVRRDRQRKEFQVKSDLQTDNSGPYPSSAEHPNPNQKPPIPPMIPFPMPVPRRGVLPIFIRYKVPYPATHGPNYINHPIPQNSDESLLNNRNAKFYNRHSSYPPIRRHLPPPSYPRRPSIFDSLRRYTATIVPY